MFSIYDFKKTNESPDCTIRALQPCTVHMLRETAVVPRFKVQTIPKPIISHLNLDPPRKHIVDSGNYNFVSLRLAHFFFLLSLNTDDLPLLSILSTLGCLFVHRPLFVSRSRPQHSDELYCSFCQLSLLISDISKHKHNSLSEIQYTANVLEELSVLHAAECRGRLGAVLLRQDDVKFPVTESASITSTSSLLGGTIVTNLHHVSIISYPYDL